MSEKKIENLQAAIKSKGYNWMSGKTSVSELSADEFKARLGLLVGETELEATARAIEAQTRLQAFAAPVALPTAVDWRNYNGADWTTSVKDQGQCGSCVAHGTVAAIESRIKIVCKDPTLNKDLSEAHLFFCGGATCSGWNFTSALNFAQNTGIGEESCFPYTPVNQPCKPCTPYVKITGWAQVLTAADRKNILATKGPMIAGMAVYQDFSSYTSGVYKHVSGALRGYHCIMVAGYDDSQQCWICKNSWGTGWGESGWFKIGYGECLIDTSFAFYDVDLNCPHPLCPPIYVTYLQKVLLLAKTNGAVRTALCYYICGRGRPVMLSPTKAIIVRNVKLILTRCPKYRLPFCRLLYCTPFQPFVPPR